MPNFRQYLVASVFAAVALLAAAAPARAQASEVKVVNPSSSPVQTKIVNPASAPVPTKIINTTGAPVQTKIVNGVTTPVPVRVVEDAAREPFQKTLNFSQSSDTSTYTVPAGKRLVIEFASAHFKLPVDIKVTSVRLTTQLSSSSGPITHFLVAYFQGTQQNGGLGIAATTDEYTASQQMKVVAGPGTQVKFSFDVSEINAAFRTGGITISGYLLPVPDAAAAASAAEVTSESQNE